MGNKLFETDSEEAVLSLILKNPELMHNTNGLRYYMFSAKPYSLLYEEFEDLLERKLTTDPLLVKNDLEAKNILSDVGGIKTLESLTSKEINADTFEELVNIVISAWKARKFISITSGVKKEGLTSTNINDEIYSVKKALESLSEEANNSTSYPIGDITDEVYNSIVERTKNPGIRGYSWGVDSMDLITGGKSPGDVWVIAGRPGMGKTAVVVNSVYQDASNGIPSLIVEREMRGQELAERLLCLDTGIPNNKIRFGSLSPEELERVHESSKKIQKYPLYLDTSYYSQDTFFLEALINKYKNQHGVEIVYVDYLQILTDRNETQTQNIGRITRMFKLLSNELGICSILLSQLNRNVEYREDKKPMLSDMRQSGSIEEDVDFAIGLYRDEQYNSESQYKGKMEFIILKHRNGPAGTITLKFDGPTNKISDINKKGKNANPS